MILPRFYPTLFYSLVVLGLCGCLHPSSGPTITAFTPPPTDAIRQQREWMVGYWYGDQPTRNGGRKRYLAHHDKDNALTLTFKIDDPLEGKAEYTERGIWGHSGPYFATLTGNDFWNIYQIEDLTADSLKFRSVATGNRYQMRRVLSDFKIEDN